MLRSATKKNKQNKQEPIEYTEKVHTDLDRALEKIKQAYSYPENTDFTIRELQIGGIDKKAALLSLSSIVDSNIINQFILSPLLNNSEEEKSIPDIVQVLSMDTKQTIKDAIKEINNGHAVLLIEGENTAYSFSVDKFEGRSVHMPENETVVKGPNEAFNEKVDTNISLIRKRIRNENLVIERQTISKRSNNEVYILYIKDIANEQLLKNVKERLKSLHTDAIQNLPILEQYMEERKYSILPSIMNTERPDRAASFIEDGYVVLLMDNSPDSLVLPATFWSFFHSPEDHYLRFMYGNFTRVLRLLAIFITLFTSAVSIAIVSYHIEMIPPDLLLAITASRDKVPFPAFVEILLMEIAFELIREAEIRVPSPIGPTIGIVGALILGQAAVEANIVSPIVVIVVALTGLCSFAIGDLNLNFSTRLIRFLFIFAAGIFGIYGMTAVFFMGVFYMVSTKSFGVPFLAPMTPSYQSSKGSIIRRTIEKEKLRPGYLKPKDMKKR